MRTERIQLTDSPKEIVIKMSEGNPGAINVMMAMITSYGNDAIFDILRLDDMNMRGVQIWVGFKDHCEGDLQVFVGCIRNRDKDMIETVNRECLHPGYFVERATVDRYAT